TVVVDRERIGSEREASLFEPSVELLVRQAMRLADSVDRAFELAERPASRTKRLERNRAIENHDVERFGTTAPARRKAVATTCCVACARRDQRLECDDASRLVPTADHVSSLSC